MREGARRESGFGAISGTDPALDRIPIPGDGTDPRDAPLRELSGDEVDRLLAEGGPILRELLGEMIRGRPIPRSLSLSEWESLVIQCFRDADREPPSNEELMAELLEWEQAGLGSYSPGEQEWSTRFEWAFEPGALSELTGSERGVGPGVFESNAPGLGRAPSIPEFTPHPDPEPNRPPATRDPDDASDWNRERLEIRPSPESESDNRDDTLAETPREPEQAPDSEDPGASEFVLRVEIVETDDRESTSELDLENAADPAPDLEVASFPSAFSEPEFGIDPEPEPEPESEPRRVYAEAVVDSDSDNDNEPESETDSDPDPDPETAVTEVEARSEVGMESDLDESAKSSESPPESREDGDSMLRHEFRLRPELKIGFKLPNDLTMREAERLAAFLRSIPFE